MSTTEGAMMALGTETEFTVWAGGDAQDGESITADSASEAAWFYCVERLGFGDRCVLNVQAFGEHVRQFDAERRAGKARVEPHDASGWV
jgi:hypothetical protein